MIDKLMKVFGTKTKALEILFLLKDLKPVVRQGFYETELSKVKEFCKNNNLAIETSAYKVVLAEKQGYSNKGFKVKIEDPRKGMFFAYISKDTQKAAMAEVSEYKNDHRGLGLLLGYPECCVDFFIKHEPERRKLDNDYIISVLKNSKGVRYPYFNNICKRNQDIVLLSHFPHSFNCEKSIELAKKRLRLVSEIDPNLAMQFARDLRCRVEINKRFVEFY